jgi:YidC/Oxa1 family membrane protein insertase
MFLQMPIWIALWQAMGTTFELRHAPFLQFFGIPLTWIHDLSQPDHLWTFKAIALPFGWHLSALNLLPFLLAAVFWLQAKNQPKPAALTPEQEQQQKMMQWMTLLFPVMLYTGPAGSNLYILTSTGIGIVESKIIRKHIKEREEAEKAGRVIVDAGKKFKAGGGKSGPDSLGLGAKPKKPGGGGGIMGWFTGLQDRAEQMRRELDKRK